MKPFQEFRLWSRSAPTGQRAATGLASALALALVVYALVPSSSKPDAGEALAGGGSAVTDAGAALDPAAPAADGAAVGQGPAPAAAPAGGSATASAADASAPSAGDPPSDAGESPASDSTGPTGGAAAGAGAPDTSRGGGAAGSATSAPPAAKQAAAARSCPQGSAPGVTQEQIKIAVILTKVVGPVGNGFFGIATPDEQRGFWRRVLADLNADGGAGCRKLVPTFYEANPADNSNLKQVCLDIAGSGAFAALDNQAYASFPIVECYPRNKVPYFGGYFVSEKIRSANYPYLFQFNSADRLVQDTIFALRDRGFFERKHGFTKLAFPYRTCDPILVEKTRRWLGEAGVSGSQIVGYDFGCPNGLSSPSDIQQAVLTFQRAGATHLTYAGFVGDFASFTRVAEQQRFRPKYGLPNDALISVGKGSSKPDPDNIAGAIAIDQGRYGEETTPGSIPTAGSRRCSAVLGAPVYELPNIAGKTCNMAWMFKAAVDNAPQLARTALASGLQKAGSVDFSYPQGPNDFAAPRTTTGGQFWRPTRFTRSCSCWRVLDPAFKRSYR